MIEIALNVARRESYERAERIRQLAAEGASRAELMRQFGLGAPRISTIIKHPAPAPALALSPPVAMIDDQDCDVITRYSWHSVRHHNTWYAIAYGGGGRSAEHKNIQMHRVVLGLQPGDEIEVDHWDGDGLNNQRHNLRKCTHAQNQRNQNATSNRNGFKGVSFRHDLRSRPWSAQITCDGKLYALGYFASREEAARAYDAAAIEHHGEFARLNFPTN